MKARAKKALSINLHSEKYIRILQMLETQLKRNRKGNSPFYHSPVRVTGAPDSRRILSNITVCNYDTTHLQENPQRLG